MLVAEHKTDLLDEVCSRIVVLDAGRVVEDDSARGVFADPRLDEWGVAPPSRVRLAHAVTARGLDPAVLA